MARRGHCSAQESHRISGAPHIRHGFSRKCLRSSAAWRGGCCTAVKFGLQNVPATPAWLAADVLVR